MIRVILNLRRYRPQEYDTNRDPRGPLTAGAEVLVGAIASFISGVGVLPLEMLQVFTTTRTMAQCKPNREDSEPPQEEREESETASTEESTQEEEQGGATVESETEDQLQDLRATGQEKKQAREPFAKQYDRISDARISLNRFAKRLLSGVILLPMDFTLSLSRGFHNAPKLYHDRMIRTTKKVIGIRSGFKVAGEVCLHPQLLRYTN